MLHIMLFTRIRQEWKWNMFKFKEKRKNKANSDIRVTKAEDENYTVKIFKYDNDLSVYAKPKTDLLPLSYMDDKIVLELPAEPILMINDVDQLIDRLKRSKKSAKDLQQFIDSNRCHF